MSEHKQRFGKLVRDYRELGELRRQKKEPHTEVLYIWVSGKGATLGATGFYEGKILRSVNNCSNDQLVEAIRTAGSLVENHSVEPRDGEYVLDLLYAQLASRANA